MTEHDTGQPDDWTKRLEREVEPPAHVRDRVVAGLRAQGVLAPGRRSFAPMWRIAAAMALFAAGWLAGTRPWATADHAGGSRFVFLIYGGDTSAGDPAGRVAEYAAWAADARRNGTRVSGERLDDSRLLLGSPDAERPDMLGGFFIVEAPSSDAARALAAGHPHVRHGGTIVVRPIAGG